MRALFGFVSVVVVSSLGIASADSKAWSVAKDSMKKLTITNDGNITELASDTDKLYVGFVGEVAVVVPKKMGDKASLKKWMGGAGAFAKGSLGKLLGKVNTSAAVFGGTIDNK